MKRLTTALLVAALAAVGCGEESEPGGPGADPVPQANGNDHDEVQNEANTFTLEMPQAPSVQAGGSQAVTFAVNRGEQFNEAVTLKFDAPQGINVAPPDPEIAAGIEDVDVTITVDQTAQPGRHTITVTATAASGENPVTEKLEIEVEAPENGGGAAPREPAGDPATDPAAPPAQPTEP